jgi:hypothetical protein
VSDWWNQPMGRAAPETEPDASGAAEGAADVCSWCSAPATPGATYCQCCGAVMAQREDLGGLVIPGVTAVEPGLASRQMVGSLLGTQARMNALGAVGLVGSPAAQLVEAAAVLARDSIAGALRPSTDPEDVGRPSQAALDMVSRLGAGQESPTDASEAGRMDPATPPEDPSQG